MAQNLTINGVTYNSVTSLAIPKAAGGSAAFPDTSDANAAAADIATGKTAYVNGSKVTGTAAGGSAPVSVAPKDVNFYDYDGTLLFAYTVTQANALSALPTAPTHTGLTFQEWNYTLAQVNAATRDIDVGATYITDDGKTRLYIHVESTVRATVPLYWSQTVANGVTVDWGDGSSTSTYSGTGDVSASHLYSSAGEYIITLYPASGCTLGLGHRSTTTAVIGGSIYGYVNCLYRIEIGQNVTTLAPSLSYLWKLSTISIPNNVTTLNSGVFSYNHSLMALIIPKSITTIPSYMADRCYSLVTVVIPGSVTTIGSSVFTESYSLVNCVFPVSVTAIGGGALSGTRVSKVHVPSGVTSVNAFVNGCLSLDSVTFDGSAVSLASSCFSTCSSLPIITLPSSVTTIGNNAFQYCAFLKEVHITATTPPTLGGSSVFDDITAYIFVPSASLATYKAEFYWSEYADRIFGE